MPVITPILSFAGSGGFLGSATTAGEARTLLGLGSLALSDTTASEARTLLGLGSLALLNNLSVPGAIGGTTANTGAFTTLSASGAITASAGIVLSGAVTVSTTGTLDLGTTSARFRHGYFSNDVVCSILNLGNAILYAPANGKIRFTNNTQSALTALLLGGSSSSFPAFYISGATIKFQLADDSGFCATQSLYDRYGSGSPEGVITAPIGAVYHRTDGGAGTSNYFKESGTGNTGWVAK